MALGLQLGADVPLFIFGRNAVGEGVGERLTALDLPPAWYLVLTPQVSVSTKEIFSDPALTRDTKPLKIPPFLSGQGRNDLEASAVRRYPEIAEHLAWLRKRSPPGCFPPRMTGSGACVFAEFSRQADAETLNCRRPCGASSRGGWSCTRCTTGLKVNECFSDGASPSWSKAPDFDSGIPRFES